MKCVHVLRKPCSEPTVAANVLRYGTGAMNVDATRIPWASPEDANAARTVQGVSCNIRFAARANQGQYIPPAQGRWPANLVLGACIDGDGMDAARYFKRVGG